MGDGVHNMINIWMPASGDRDFCTYFGNRQVYFENSFLKRASYVLMCIEGFMVSLIAKFYVFVNMCLFLSTISMKE